MNIFLVGPMGAGKSSVGLRLSKILKRDFLDSDTAIVESTGVDIAYIFETEGEKGFRVREQDVIDELTRNKDLILATGGGVVISEMNRTNLSMRGVVVYLEASIERLLLRTKKDNSRPLLQTKNPEKSLRAIVKARKPLYEEIADITIDTENSNVEQIAQRIITEVEMYQKGLN